MTEEKLTACRDCKFICRVRCIVSGVTIRQVCRAAPKREVFDAFSGERVVEEYHNIMDINKGEAPCKLFEKKEKFRWFKKG